MAVHHLVLTIFFVGFGLFFVAETARMGAQANPACEHQDDTDVNEYDCNGYGAGAVFSMFAAVAAFVAAAFAKRGPVAWYPYLGALICYSLAKVAETGGQSQRYCDDDSFSEDDDRCDGYSAAAVFYFFAFAVAIASGLLLWKWAESRHFALVAFYVFLTCFSIGMLAEIGGSAASFCNTDDTGFDDLDDAIDTYCNGFGFAAFVASMSALSMAVFAVLTFLRKDTGSNLWLGAAIFNFLYLLYQTSVYGAIANVQCDILEGDDDASENRCSGNAAGTFFYTLGLVTALGAIFFSFRHNELYKQGLFLGTYSLFYLGYTCAVGGESAAGCATAEDIDEDDSIGAQEANDTCSGYAAATFFAFVAFLLLAVAAVLTRFPQGAPQPEDEKGAEPSAPEKDATATATATPVVATAVPVKDGADV